MRTGHDDLGTAENEYGKRLRDLKTSNQETTPSLPSKTSPGASNMKTGPDAPSTAENESGSAKHENGTRRPRYRRKGVRERKI
jgi:hypothetical protein